MSLAGIKGQDRAMGLLTAAHEAGRLSHAYLFHGPEGVGKEATALEFAKALNCECEGLEACGRCRSCAMIAGLSHPDVQFVFPLPRDTKPEALAEIKAEFVRNSYREEEFRKAAIISVETVLNSVVVKANQRPYLGRWKVFILADADKMTTEAANTLLKTLEEPPEKTVIILTTARPSALPSTVISRCQKIPFGRLPDELVEDILVDKLGLDRPKAHSLAALARGSAGRAIRMKDGVQTELDNVASIMSGRRTRDVPSLINEAQRLAFRLGRDQQQKLLDLMLLWYRDVLLLSVMGEKEIGAGARGLLYDKHIDSLRAAAAGTDSQDLEQLITKLEEARGALERYSNSSIVFTSVLLDMAVARKRAQTRRQVGHAR